MRVLVLRLEGAAVPAVRPELVLTLVDGDLHALDGRGRDVWEAAADVVLAVRQARVRLAHGVGVEARLCRDRQTEDVVAQCPARKDSVMRSM